MCVFVCVYVCGCVCNYVSSECGDRKVPVVPFGTNLSGTNPFRHQLPWHQPLYTHLQPAYVYSLYATVFKWLRPQWHRSGRRKGGYFLCY